MGDIAQRGNRLTFAKGGRAGKAFGGPSHSVRRGVERLKEHAAKKEAKKVQAGKDKIQKSEMGYAKGGRIGLKKGGKPWGTGPKPGTHEFMMQDIHKKRKGKAIGGILKVGKQAVQKIINKIRKKPETTWKELDIPGYPPIHKGKYPGIDKAMENVKKHGDIRGPGKAKGGRIGYKVGFHVKPKPKEWPSKDWQKFKPRTWPKQKSFVEQLGGSEKGKPHSTKEGRIASGTRRIKRLISADKKAEGGRIGLKKGKK